jgi:hypothetical protein
MNANPPPKWQLGQKVVCVNDAFPRAVLDWCDFLPRAGCVYTIRAIQLGLDGVTRLPSLGFLLDEFVNPPSSLGKEAGFDVSRFEPWLASDLETNHATDQLAALRQRQLIQGAIITRPKLSAAVDFIAAQGEAVAWPFGKAENELAPAHQT